MHGDIKDIKKEIKSIGYDKDCLSQVKHDIEHSIKVRKAEAPYQPNRRLDDTHARRVRQEQDLLKIVNDRLTELNQ